MKRAGFLLVGVLAGCNSTPPPSTDDFQDRLLATIPEGVDVLIPPAFAPNGRSVVYVARTHEGDRAVRDQWKSRRYDFIC
jgi:hypothetical protein